MKGVEQTGAMRYYDLRGRIRSGGLRLEYRAGVEVHTEEGYFNTVRIDVRGLSLPHGVYGVRHPQDPNAENTVISLIAGRGRVMNELMLAAPPTPPDVPDPEAFFPPNGPVTNLSATSGCLEFVDLRTGVVVATLDSDIEWAVQGECSDGGDVGDGDDGGVHVDGGLDGSFTFVMSQPVLLRYAVSLDDPCVPVIRLVAVDLRMDTDLQTEAIEDSSTSLIRKNACAAVELTVNRDGTVTSIFSGFNFGSDNC